MTQQLHSQPTNRFAWLTPLRRQSTGAGRWMLCERNCPINAEYGAGYTHISVNALLHMLATAFDKRERQGQNIPGNENSMRSDCGRYEARLIRQENDNSRLFVQKRSDFFARIELHADDQLLVSYQEPVWPHLQVPHPLVGERLSIPQGCVALLESLGATRSNENCAANSDNCTPEFSEDGSVAA